MSRKPYSEYTDEEWSRMRQLAQYRKWPDAKWLAHVDALKSGSGGEIPDIANLEAELKPEHRGFFKKLVRDLRKTASKDADPTVVKAIVENFAYANVLLRQSMISGYKSGLPDMRGLREFNNALLSMLEALSQTAKERRIAGKKSDDVVSALLSRSVDAAMETRTKKPEVEQKAEELFGSRGVPKPDPELATDVEATDA